MYIHILRLAVSAILASVFFFTHAGSAFAYLTPGEVFGVEGGKAAPSMEKVVIPSLPMIDPTELRHPAAPAEQNRGILKPQDRSDRSYVGVGRSVAPQALEEPEPKVEMAPAPRRPFLPPPVLPESAFAMGQEETLPLSGAGTGAVVLLMMIAVFGAFLLSPRIPTPHFRG
jgi:hypothetical protein